MMYLFFQVLLRVEHEGTILRISSNSTHNFFLSLWKKKFENLKLVNERR